MSAPADPAPAAGLAAYRPQLRQQVLISDELLHDAAPVRVLKDPDRGQSFRVGVKEHFLLARMDGSRTVAELGTAYAAEYGRRLDDRGWQRILAMLGSRGLLTDSPAPTPPAAPDGAAGEPGPGRRNTLLRGELRVVADADDAARRLHRTFGFLLARGPLLPLLALVAAMEVALLAHFGELLDGTWALFRNPVLLAGAAVLLWLSTTLHELAHGVVARHHGGQVAEIGLRWRLPLVMMYCRVDNFVHLPTRAARIATAVAGFVMNLVFLLPFAAVWFFVPVDEATGEALAGLLFLGSLQAFAMLVPLPPLDGYKIVNQLAGTTELAAASRRYLRLRGRRDPAADAYPRRARRLYTGYAAGAALVLCGLAAAVAALVYAAVVAL